jgi:hypothetical protein
MWRGDTRAPHAPTRYEARLQPVFDALRAAGLAPEPAVYFDDRAAEVRSQLLGCAGVLVWINPLADGANRTIVDDVLRDVSANGVWVSAHPDVIQKMGAKRVVFDTRDLSWGSDTDLYLTIDAFDARFPGRCARGPRVLKPNRGNDGQGVLKAAQVGDDVFDVQRASDDARSRVSFIALRSMLQPCFEAAIPVIDQAFHPVTSAGMVRCYMSGAQVIGFGVQALRSEDLEQAFGMNSSKAMHAADFAPLADLQASMEDHWTPAMQSALSIAAHELPALWDADFLFRTELAHNRSRFALCEINASCVSPFPLSAPEAIAKAAVRMLRQCL